MAFINKHSIIATNTRDVAVVRRIGTLFCSIFISLTLAFSFSLPANALSKEESSAISGNCSTIKQSLSQLQKADARTRTYLGTTYETIINKFITPLNLRLVHNNRPTLSDIQAAFTEEQTKFRNAYTEYMRELESLLAVDCQAEPTQFYDQLTVVREKRSKVNSATVELRKLSKKQYDAVSKLRKGLQ